MATVSRKAASGFSTRHDLELPEPPIRSIQMKNRSSLRTYRPCLGAAVAAAFALVAAPARAADAKAAPAAKASSPDAEIRATALAFVQAFDRGDAKTVAAQWLPEGTAAEADGTMYKGREAIEREYAQLFKQYPDARVSVAVKSI